MKDSPVLQRAPRLRDQVYAALRGMLGDGSFPEGRVVEEEMAERLGVSRTPVREALFQLCREGVLEDTGRGYRRPELTAADVAEIVELRRLLEPAMARAIVARMTPASLEAFASVIAREDAAIAKPDPADFVEANAAFRQIFLDTSGNRRIAQVMRVFDDQISHLRRTTLGPPENRQATVEQHRRFFAALAARDAEGAAEAIAGLLNVAGAYYERMWVSK